MNRSSYNWALRGGLPASHLIQAALLAGTLVDACGSPVPSTHEGYRVYPSDALFPPCDLELGEHLLVDCGLLLESESCLHPTPDLHELLTLDEKEAFAVILERAVKVAIANDLFVDSADELGAQVDSLAERMTIPPERREEILIALGLTHDAIAPDEIAAMGEEYIADSARSQLIDIDRSDLAMRVRRVSLLSDQLGYDIIAPKKDGTRRLEVKTSSASAQGLFHFFISRNEFDWGLRDKDWALVACSRDSDGEMGLVGWLRAQALQPYLPIDAEGSRWTKAEANLPVALFTYGLPPLD